MLVCSMFAHMFVVFECMPCFVLQSGDLAGAVSATSKALHYSPSHLKSLLLRAAALRGLGQLIQSLEDIESAACCVPTEDRRVASTPSGTDSEPVTVATLLARSSKGTPGSVSPTGFTHPDVLHQRNLTLNALAIQARVNGNTAEALRLFDAIIAADPSCVQFVINRADALFEAGRLEEVCMCVHCAMCARCAMCTRFLAAVCACMFIVCVGIGWVPRCSCYWDAQCFHATRKNWTDP